MRKYILLLALTGLAIPTIGSSDDINFAKQIYPFVKSGCVKCHSAPYKDERGRTRKPKAGIIMTTKEGLLAEYDLDSGDTKAILVPGKPDESRMLEVTKLPIDDDLHFPPEGKAPQWTAAEQELFAKWVAAGADFGDWTEDPAPQEGLEWDGEEKKEGTTETAE